MTFYSHIREKFTASLRELEDLLDGHKIKIRGLEKENYKLLKKELTAETTRFIYSLRKTKEKMDKEISEVETRFKWKIHLVEEQLNVLENEDKEQETRFRKKIHLVEEQFKVIATKDREYIAELAKKEKEHIAENERLIQNLKEKDERIEDLKTQLNELKNENRKYGGKNASSKNK